MLTRNGEVSTFTASTYMKHDPPDDAPDWVHRASLPVVWPEHDAKALVGGRIPDELALSGNVR